MALAERDEAEGWGEGGGEARYRVLSVVASCCCLLSGRPFEKTLGLSHGAEAAGWVTGRISSASPARSELLVPSRGQASHIPGFSLFPSRHNKAIGFSSRECSIGERAGAGRNLHCALVRSFLAGRQVLWSESRGEKGCSGQQLWQEGSRREKKEQEEEQKRAEESRGGGGGGEEGQQSSFYGRRMTVARPGPPPSLEQIFKTDGSG